MNRWRVRRWQRPAVALLAALLALLGSMVAAASASAHSSEIGAAPAAGDLLAEAPTEVTIEFDVPLIDMGTAIAVRGSAKESIVTGPPTVDGRFLSVPVDGTASPDTYTVAYRVVSEDGHTISSTYTYTVAGAASNAPTTAPSLAESTVADSQAAVPAPGATTASDVPEGTGGLSPMVIVAGVAFIVILAFVGAIALRR